VAVLAGRPASRLVAARLERLPVWPLVWFGPFGLAVLGRPCLRGYQ